MKSGIFFVSIYSIH